MSNETFNAEAARKAVENARTEIQELVKNFEKTRENVAENFDQNATTTAAIGGLLGSQAQRTFEENNSSVFDQLNSKMDDFVNNRVETIIKNSIETEDAARATYGS